MAGIQNSARVFLASQAEKDYEQLEKIIINLVLFATSRQPSQFILSEVINKLADEVARSSDQISPYRLRLAYKIDELMKAVAARLILDSPSSGTDSDNQSLVDELRSRIKLLSEQFNSLLITSQENKTEVNKRVQEISSLSRNISDLHSAIFNRDADIAVLRNNTQELTELTHRKQDQIKSLQNSIFELQKDIQDITNYARQKESEVEDLKDENSHLDLQKSELQRKYQSLHQNYQQKQNETANLKKRLEDLSETNQTQPQSSTHATPQPSVKPVATKSKISVEEWGRIANQREYVSS